MGNGGSSLSDTQRAFIASQMKLRYEAEAAAGKSEAELHETMTKYYNDLIINQSKAKHTAKPKRKTVPRRRSFDNEKHPSHKSKDLPPKPPGKVAVPTAALPPVEVVLEAPITTAATETPILREDPTVPQEGCCCVIHVYYLFLIIF
jgi:hypothetical protein